MRKAYRFPGRIVCVEKGGCLYRSPPLSRVEAACCNCPAGRVEILDLAGTTIEQVEPTETSNDIRADPDDIVVQGLEGAGPAAGEERLK